MNNLCSNVSVEYGKAVILQWKHVILNDSEGSYLGGEILLPVNIVVPYSWILSVVTAC